MNLQASQVQDKTFLRVLFFFVFLFTPSPAGIAEVMEREGQVLNYRTDRFSGRFQNSHCSGFRRD